MAGRWHTVTMILMQIVYVCNLSGTKPATCTTQLLLHSSNDISRMSKGNDTLREWELDWVEGHELGDIIISSKATPASRTTTPTS